MQRVHLRRVLLLISFGALAALGTLGGCTSDACPNYTGAVVSRADDDADFASYETFAIKKIIEDDVGAAGAGGQGALMPDEVRLNLEVASDAAADELLQIGLREVDPDVETPDLWVFSAAATDVEEGMYWYCVPGWYWWWGYYDYTDPCVWLVPIEFEYVLGTVLVGVADSETNQPVFGGLIQGVLECTPDVEQSIEDGVDEIFDDYPR